MRPLCIDLFCGLGGWAEGFMAEGYDVVGFDIERHEYGEAKYPAQLVLQDALTLHGSQFRNAAVIVASPPCQNWAQPSGDGWEVLNSVAAKEQREKWEREGPDNRLFDACFRIQREASEAAGRHIPLVVENVRGAQPWVGRAQANYGSFFLWGDVVMVGRRIVRRDAGFGALALVGAGRKNDGGSWFNIGSPGQAEVNCNPVHKLVKGHRIADSSQGDRGQKVPGFRFDGSGRSFQTAAVNAANEAGLKRPGEGALLTGSRGNTSKGFNNWPKDENGAYVMPDGTKIGGDWFSDPNSTCRKHGSRSDDPGR